jgi:hypothetical protein
MPGFYISLVMVTVEPDVEKMLMKNEEVLFIAKQRRLAPGGSLFTPDSIYVTNRRIIFRNPHLLGLKKNYIDFDYRDISNIRIEKGVFSSDIYLDSRFKSEEIMLPGVNNDDAAKISAYIQGGMRGELPRQITTEKRTETNVEIVGKASSENPIEQLQKLGQLRDAGVITEEEFERKKQELLKRI